MPGISEQYNFETNAWLRTLDYLQQENIHMKTRLAAIVKANLSPEMLEKIEYFQNAFLNKDTVIAFLRRDINKLKSSAVSNGAMDKLFVELGADVKKMELEFSNLKSDFNTSLHLILNPRN